MELKIDQDDQNRENTETSVEVSPSKRIKLSKSITKTPTKFQGFIAKPDNSEMVSGNLLIEDELNNENDWKHIEVLLQRLSTNKIVSVLCDFGVILEWKTKEELIPKLIQHLRKLKESHARSTFIRILCICGIYSWMQITEHGLRILSCEEYLLKNPEDCRFPDYNAIENPFQANLEGLSKALDIDDEIDDIEDEALYEKIEELKYNATELSTRKSHLPMFLQKYSVLGVNIISLNKAVARLERLKKFEKAVDLLQFLVSLNKMDEFRGHWFERLALDCSSYLKQKEDALEHIMTGMNDSGVPMWRKLMLRERAKKMKGINTDMLDMLSIDLQIPDDLPYKHDLSSPEKKIKPEFDSRKPVRKSVWEYESKSGDTTFGSVEEVCLNNFLSGNIKGAHDEGRIVKSLMVLLFWDVIYHASNVADVFLSSFQTAPLDWDTEYFYQARKDEIQSRFATLSSFSREQLADVAVSMWKKCKGLNCLVDWVYLTSEDLVKELLLCMDPKPLLSIMKKLISDHLNTKYGMPDLMIWNIEERRFWFVEVKGPRDTLSTKQSLWLDFLRKLGIQADVCDIVTEREERIESEADFKRKLQF